MTTLKQLREDGLGGAIAMKKAIGINRWGVSGFGGRFMGNSLNMPAGNIRTNPRVRRSLLQARQALANAEKTGNKDMEKVATQQVVNARDNVKDLSNTQLVNPKKSGHNTIEIPK